MASPSQQTLTKNDLNASLQKQQQPCSGVFRSEEMLYCQLFLQSNVVFEVTCRLGELGIIEFQDLNTNLNAYQRKYVDEIRHISEIQRKLIYIHQELQNRELSIVESINTAPIPKFREMRDLENRIEKIDNDLREINKHLHSLRAERSELIEMSIILSKTNQLLETTRRERQSSFNGQYPINNNDQMIDIENDQLTLTRSRQPQQQSGSECNRIYTITGLLRAEKTLAFRKIIWRICGQNALVQFFDIENPIDDADDAEYVQKKVFLIMCQGDRLNAKIKKICDGFHASQYPLPDDESHYRRLCEKVEKNLKEMQIIIDETRQQYLKILESVAKSENFPTWIVQVTKLRAVYATMNLYLKTEKSFLAEGWCARSDYHLLVGVIEEINQRVGILGQATVEIVSTTNEPPTFFRTNRFTQGFQNIVDSYGIATYREMNPAPYTIITFPFLFAMMFADAGHGFIMMLFGLWMVMYERRLKGKSSNEIWLTFFDGRYIILLMGIFSIYTGSVYNDIFAKSYNLFSTKFDPFHPSSDSWIANMTDKNNTQFNMTLHHNLLIYIDKKEDQNYPYGIDPVWQLSSNKIIFLNSFKMKLSVIVGVLQMLFGVMISLFNHINSKSMVSILFEFIPQIIFLLSLFGYLILLIFMKWFRKWTPSLAPSILIDFINMFLMKYPNDQKSAQYLNPWYPHKKEIQTFLLILALLQVPIMLLVKPLIIMFSRKRSNSSQANNRQESNCENNVNNNSHSNGNHHEESVGDLFTHQAIHTIEYCLGSISHTASYLRLWALSLAHSQLSEVLWNRLMHTGFANDNPSIYVRILMTYITFALWAVLTVAILIVMEGLSAFLHALRLHWVEFQSKFYAGAGFAFHPFHLNRIISETNILIE